jgi:hypothetical protein
MSGLVNRSGIRYGNLIAKERINSNGRPKWLCDCDCGKSIIVAGGNLTSGNTISCGCAWKKAVKKEMIGKIFGRLTVIEDAESITNGKSIAAKYKCKCECGGEIITMGMSLRNGDTISCGCAYKIAGEKRIKPYEHHRSEWQFRNKRRRAARINSYKPFNIELFDLIEREAYDLCAIRLKTTGIAYQVDHIIPLQSKYVCGLHNEFNLRVITAKENNIKGNRFWPDMPNIKRVSHCSK